MFGEFSSLLVKDKTALALVFYLNFSMVFVCCLAQGFAVGGNGTRHTWSFIVVL